LGTVRRDAAARDNAVKMGMMEQILSPGVKHSEEADLGAQMFGIGGDGRQGFGSGFEQDAIYQILVLISDAGNVFGNSKDNVKIFAIQNLGFSFFNPLGAGERLALWTVPIAATVVAGPFVMT
jgi:hypothetical protein